MSSFGKDLINIDHEELSKFQTYSIPDPYTCSISFQVEYMTRNAI